MTLTDEERTKIAHETGVLPSGVGDRELCELMFAAAIEREVLRKLREAGPVAYKISHPHEPDLGFWFGEEDMTELDYLSEPLFTIPEDQQ
jgi:hypothetical protein